MKTKMTGINKLTSSAVMLIMFLISAAHSCTSQNKGSDFVRIFDGKTLNGWDADTSFWRVENGTIVGEVLPGEPIKANTFLIWKDGEPEDFEFKAEYRISPEGNSGVQYRSEKVNDVGYALRGYQADIDGANQYTGQNYEERGRGFLAMRGQKVVLKANEKPEVTGSVGNSDSLKALIKGSDWNEIHIVAKGNKMRHSINEVLMSEAVDEDGANRKFSGLLGMQVHVMPHMKVEYRNIFLKKL